jgi:hypothetical protein
MFTLQISQQIRKGSVWDSAKAHFLLKTSMNAFEGFDEKWHFRVFLKRKTMIANM